VGQQNELSARSGHRGLDSNAAGRVLLVYAVRVLSSTGQFDHRESVPIDMSGMGDEFGWNWRCCGYRYGDFLGRPSPLLDVILVIATTLQAIMLLDWLIRGPLQANTE